MKQTRKFTTACGGFINISPKSENHLQAHPDVNKFLPEAICRVVLPSSGFMSAEVEFDRFIGKTSRVKTAPCDIDTSILFAQRNGRDKPSRVAPIGTIGEDTRSIVILATPSRSEPRTYELVTSWLGKRLSAWMVPFAWRPSN